MVNKNSRAFMMWEICQLDRAALTYETKNIGSCPLNYEPTGYDEKSRRYTYPNWCTMRSLYDPYTGEYDSDCDGATTGCACTTQICMNIYFTEGKKYRTLRQKKGIKLLLEALRGACDDDKILKYLPNDKE